MDQYTSETKIWLDKRFRNCDEQGIYYAHQPIYGFRKGHSEPGFVTRYIRTYQIMKALSHLRFNSLLDVGAAEGYKAYIANRLFGVKVKCCDLSEESCNRAEEIFNIDSTPADIHDLPFKNSEFDVILCSETLEHVTDLHKSIDELLRVASKAVIITVPHESEKVVDKNIEEDIPHAHIHSFDLDHFNFLKSDGYNVLSRKMISSLLSIPALVLTEGRRREYHEKMKYPKMFIDIYNACVPIFRNLFGKRTAAFLIRLDDHIPKLASSYNAILYIILKDDRCYTEKEIVNVSASRIIDFAVPYHYLKKDG